MPFAPTPVLHARMQLPCMFSLPADTHPRSHAYTHGLSSCVVCLWWAQVLPKVVQHLHKQEAKRAAFQLGVLERLQSLTQRHRDADLEGNRALGAPRVVRIYVAKTRTFALVRSILRLTRSLRGPHCRRAHRQHRPRSRAAAVPAGARGGGGGDGRLVGRPRRRDGLGNVAAVARVQGAAACGAAAAGQARVHGALAPIARSENEEWLAGSLETSQMPPRTRVTLDQTRGKLNGSAAPDHAGTSGCASCRPTTCYTSSKRRTAPRLSPRFASSAAATWAGWEVVVGR